ncbi:hypothetical protein MBLNU459_g6465t1 [Dothideomycetes sp. NU459]
MDISDCVYDCKYYKILSSYITKSINLSTALSDFTTSASDPSRSYGGFTLGWTALILIAAKQAHDSQEQESLVEFVLGLRDNHNAIEDGMDYRWHDLPDFGLQARESANFNESRAENDAELKARWVGFNAFFARLTQASSASHPSTPAAAEGGGDNDDTKTGERDPLDFSLYAIWFLREALEESNSPSDVAVTAGAMWMLYSAPTLWLLSKQKNSFEGRKAMGGSEYGNKEWKGFSEERWQLWENRLEKIAESVTDEKTRHVLDAAKKAMKDAGGK